MSRARNLSDVGGISYITATGNKVGIGSTIPQRTLDVNGDVRFTGTLYQGGSAFSSGVGIQSAGTVIGTGITTLNFIGLGNTFAVNGNTVNISITGGGSASYASTAGIATYATSAGIATYATSAGIATNATTAGYATTAGIATVAQGLTGTPSITVNNVVGAAATFSGLVGINTSSVTGSATSEGTLQASGNISIRDGVYMMDANINANVTVPAGKNALMIGPITVGTGYTVTVQSGSTLVVV